MVIDRIGATLMQRDAPMPVFYPVIRTIAPRGFGLYLFGNDSKTNNSNVAVLSQYFGVSVNELEFCIKGVATDKAVFGYEYSFGAQKSLSVRAGPSAPWLPVEALSSGEQARLVIDLAVSLAKYASNVSSPILLLNQRKILMDPAGW
jgi:hypothetical protein